ncbi:MAG: T9SS type A sorting domain-containing protein [Candidatus Eisenbacteria bacterium]|nr:T9SS type A sorting domain-containing protein [Candidatus Latescibacterota bacterium]MBD3302738.1 T9SS type A sorting domain-containing protein [Candidatus Eisenbacteria bacterium]
MIHFENHVSTTDPFTIPKTTQRANWYGVGGIPHVRIDGRHSVIGAGSCASAASNYRNYINQRLAANGGISPVAIEGSYLPTASDVTVQATFRLEDPATLSDLRATLLVYEDNVFWCCGYGGVSNWDVTTRAIYDENVTLNTVGDEVTISETFIHNGDWDPNETHAVAYLQTTTGLKEIHQGARLPLVQDFDFDLTHRVRSVPDGNGMAVFPATLTNISDETDTFTLELGAPFGDWSADFLVCGDNTPHTDPVEVVLAPDEVCEIEIRVHTDAMKEVRSGGFQVGSEGSGRVQPNELRVFNGSYSVLLVDDDSGQDSEIPIESAIEELGYLYEDWDITNGHDDRSPVFVNMSGFDFLIWQTGFRFNQLLSEDDTIALMEYIDNGGSLFLTSQEFLDSQEGPTTFVMNYLGVDSWTEDVAFEQMNGVDGDPIGDGLTLTLDFDIPSFNQTDDAVPGSGETAFLAPDGSHAMVRNEVDGAGKSVFMPVPFDAIVDEGPLAGTQTTLLERVFDWLRPSVPAGVGDPVAGLLGSRVIGANPNPFNPRTEVVFLLSNSGAAGPVALEIYDLEGRKVAGLVDGALTAGRHSATWNGRTDEGTPVESGVYFARLTTIEGQSGQKIVLLK